MATKPYGKCRITNKQSAFFGEVFDFYYFPSAAGYRDYPASLHTLPKIIPAIDPTLPAPGMSFEECDTEVIEIYPALFDSTTTNEMETANV